MAKENNKCIFCNSEKIEHKLSSFAPFLIDRMFDNRKQPTRLVRCKDCGIEYSSYRPTDKEMSKLYSGYRDEDYQKQRQKYEPNYTKEFNRKLGINPHKKPFLNKLFRKYIDTSKVSSILDYGGDRGQHIPDCFPNAKKYVYEISNVDALEGIININNEETLKSQKYDVIMCCQVLEHVSNPQKLIKDMCDICNDKGYIYIDVPPEYDFSSKCFHEHINNFRPKSFTKLPNIINNINIKCINTDNSIYVLFRKEKCNIVKQYLKIKLLRIKNISYPKNLYIKLLTSIKKVKKYYKIVKG